MKLVRYSLMAMIVCFVSCSASEYYEVCKKKFMQALRVGNTRALLNMIESKSPNRWLERFPFLDLLNPMSQIYVNADIAESFTIDTCSDIGQLSCIRAFMFDRLKKSFAWGCDREGKPFITVAYSVRLYGGSVVRRLVIQHFIQAQISDMDTWISRAHDGSEKFISHSSAFCSDQVSGEEAVDWEDFQTLAKLILEGNVIVKSQKYGFLRLELYNSAYYSPLLESTNSTHT